MGDFLSCKRCSKSHSDDGSGRCAITHPGQRIFVVCSEMMVTQVVRVDDLALSGEKIIRKMARVKLYMVSFIVREGQYNCRGASQDLSVYANIKEDSEEMVRVSWDPQ